MTVAIVCALPMAGTAPAVKASLDSANLLMGRMGELQLQIVLDKGQRPEFPMVGQASQDGLIPLLADTVELRMSFSCDTVALGGNRIQLNCRFPMQAFVPGEYMIPSIPVVIDGDTVESTPLALKVTGPDVQATDSISPDAGPLEPYYKSDITKATDKIPDFIYYYWWIIVILLIAAGALVWYLKKHPVKRVPWMKPRPEPTPYELAMSRLRSLRESNLCGQGQEKEYYSRLTDILREYLWGRFGINAMEMTTQQIRKAVRNTPDAKAGKKYIEDVLGMADFVKFAKFKPLPDDNAEAFENVVRFVEQTKPLPKPEESADSNLEPEKKTEA